MKKAIILYTLLSLSNLVYGNELKVFSTCDHILNSNINVRAKNTLLSAGVVKILKSDNEYTISYEIDQMKFKNKGSILSLNTGCGEKQDFSDPCLENDESIRMAKNFNDETNSVVKGYFNKITSELEIVHEIGTDDHKTILSDVLFSCH
jgi:hypothetical protein